MNAIRVVIASDHAGFEQKQQLAAWIVEQGYALTDLGPQSDDAVDYPDYAAVVAQKVADRTADFGILVCGSGIGMAIVANKFDGVRAANVTNPEFAVLAREHNNSNVLTLSGRFVDLQTNISAVANFLTTPFAGGRHGGRVEKIAEIEKSSKLLYYSQGESKHPDLAIPDPAIPDPAITAR